ncbi:predicted protein [Chaetomium globosum CBS 148.51]|uniref:Amidoligase enzyme n=1 Tax=Chaetomium globosum (strain ATCC 6205 / CBS 148.51 / DSM 1962 / NBRC 6347 / NRRL 1970) TaxID=306901 RepID=Q2HBL2_CHAGB|nr:uncharacterized protein CHGG_02392 [Chaetomium globosum CBS 148.51]EAQ90457.1 predicted protein [Chaetomium globosum CBS 148.51]
MSSRTTATGGTSSSNRRAPPTTTPANVASGRATPATQPTRRPRSSSNAAASSSSVAVNGPKPLFGVEIEIFVKLRPELERAIYTRRQRGEQLDEEYWRNWNFALSNEKGNQPLKDKQRECVGQAIEALIEGALGPNHHWKCEPDASLKEWALTEPPEPRKWWGIEIISPPMSAARQWRQEIHEVFAAVAEEFELWTSTFCACHVHVSPGPLKSSKYNFDQLVQIACASHFWEEALKTILPEERKINRYAQPNATVFANAEYNTVSRYTWAPVFQAVKSAAGTAQKFAARYPSEDRTKYAYAMFACLMAGAKVTDPDPSDTAERYLSSNFLPLPELGTVELRRQAGVASAHSTIQRALLALTLHVSALQYDFVAAASRRDHPTQAELKTELSLAIKRLPASCRGDRFLKCAATPTCPPPPAGGTSNPYEIWHPDPSNERPVIPTRYPAPSYPVVVREVVEVLMREGKQLVLRWVTVGRTRVRRVCRQLGIK